MAESTMYFSLNQRATYFKAMGCYLADLPILDRRVLQQYYAERRDTAAIALDMAISTNHVERILARAAEFKTNLLVGKQALPVFPVWTQSPIASC